MQDTLTIVPRPIDIIAPVWPFKSQCTPDSKGLGVTEEEDDSDIDKEEKVPL